MTLFIGILIAVLFLGVGFIIGSVWAHIVHPKPIDKGSEVYITVLKAFFDLCIHHDWRYADSDDARVYNKGHEQAEVLFTMMNNYPAMKPVYDAWHDYAFKGGSKPSIAFFL